MLEVIALILIVVLLVPSVYVWSKYEARQNMLMKQRHRARRKALEEKKKHQDQMYEDYLKRMNLCEAWIVEGDVLYNRYEPGNLFYKSPEYEEYSARGNKLIMQLMETDYYKYMHRKRK